MKRKGFAFNKGLRIALNYGYYRLLPMKTSFDSNERITEFYGPGIVELSRLTTGKANKEIEEIGEFLIAHGYEQAKVQQFFAPLARGVDVIDHKEHAREYYAYLDANNHLVNEGIVASMALLQELSNELADEGTALFRVKTSWGDVHRLRARRRRHGAHRHAAHRQRGAQGSGEHRRRRAGAVRLPARRKRSCRWSRRNRSSSCCARTSTAAANRPARGRPCRRRPIRRPRSGPSAAEIVICVKTQSPDLEDEVLIGEWDPRSDDVRRPLRIPRGDFQRLFSLKGELTADVLAQKKESVREMYERLSTKTLAPALALGAVS